MLRFVRLVAVLAASVVSWSGCGGTPLTPPAKIIFVPQAFPILGPISPGLPEHFLAWLEHAGQEPLVVIDSPGGEMRASATVALAIRMHKNVRCIVTGLAGSGAFGIFQQCKTRLMLPDAKLATHELKVTTEGPMDRHEARAIADQMDRLAYAWNELVRWRLRLSPAEYGARVKGQDWVMDASEAIRIGAADGVFQAP